MSAPEHAAGPSARRWTVALVAVAALYVALIPREQLLTFDPTYYLGLAASLVRGDGYTFLGVTHTTYPPGLPAMFVPLVALVGPSVNAAQLLIALCAPLAVLGVLAYARLEFPRSAPAIAALACGSYGFFLLATDQLRSEMPYLVVTVWALVLLLRADGSPVSRRWLSVAGIALLTASAVLFRTIGVALPLAMLCAWAHRRVRRIAATHHDAQLLAGAAGGLAAATAWFLWTGSHGSNGYVNYLLLKDPHDPDLGPMALADVGERVAEAFAVQLAHVAELLTGLPWVLPTWLSPLAAIIAIVLGLGLVVELRRERAVVAWYVMGYGAIVLLWPFDEGPRFVAPAMAFVVVLMLKGAGEVWRAGIAAWAGGAAVLAGGCIALALLRVGGFPLESTQGMAMVALWGVIGAVALASIVKPGFVELLVRHQRRLVAVYLLGFGALHAANIVPKAIANVRGQDTSVHAAMRPGVDWLRNNAAPGSVVIAQFDATIHFYTGLTAVALPATRDGERLERVFLDARPQYIVVNDTPEYPYMFPTEEERFDDLVAEVGADRFERVFRFGAGTVYRVR